MKLPHTDTLALPISVFLFCCKQVKDLPTFKDMDFRNNMQKVYVTEEQKEKFMEKLNKDVEVITVENINCTLHSSKATALM